MTKYLLEFQNNRGLKKECGYYNSISETKRAMFQLIKAMDFECLYTREVKRENYLWIDFGKHHEFFRIYEVGDKNDLPRR